MPEQWASYGSHDNCDYAASCLISISVILSFLRFLTYSSPLTGSFGDQQFSPHQPQGNLFTVAQRRMR